MKSLNYYFVQDEIYKWSFYNKNNTLCGTILRVQDGYSVHHAPFDKTPSFIESNDFSFVQNLILSNPVFSS